MVRPWVGARGNSAELISHRGDNTGRHAAPNCRTIWYANSSSHARSGANTNTDSQSDTKGSAQPNANPQLRPEPSSVRLSGRYQYRRTHGRRTQARS